MHFCYALKRDGPCHTGKGRFLMRSNLPDIEQTRTLPQWGRSSDLFFVVETTELEPENLHVMACSGVLSSVTTSTAKTAEPIAPQDFQKVNTYKSIHINHLRPLPSKSDFLEVGGTFGGTLGGWIPTIYFLRPAGRESVSNSPELRQRTKPLTPPYAHPSASTRQHHRGGPQAGRATNYHP